MAYLDTYKAFAIAFDGTKTEWNGLRKTQAQWRYNWIRRNAQADCNWPKEFGWTREFVSGKGN